MLCYSPEIITQFSENDLAKIILSTAEPHGALLVSKTASFEEAKAAFKQIALKLHPDKSTSTQAVEAFKKARDALYQMESLLLKQARWSAESNEQSAFQADPGLDKDRLQSAKAAWAKPKDAVGVKKKKKKKSSKASRSQTAGRASQLSTSEEEACSPANKAGTEELHDFAKLSHHSPSVSAKEGGKSCASKALRQRWALPHNGRESIAIELTSSSEDEGPGSWERYGNSAGRTLCGRVSADMPAEELTAQQRWQKRGATRSTGLLSPVAMKSSSQSESASESDREENPVEERETAAFARFACRDPPRKGFSELQLKRVGKRLWKGSVL